MVFDTVQIIEVVLIVLFLLMSAFFSGSETAYTGLSRARLKAMDPDGKDRRVARALANYDDFDRLLTTLLVGNNISNTAASSLCTALMISLLGDLGTLVATILMITVLLILSEITPKTIAKHNAEGFAVKFGGGVHMAIVILSPITFFFLGATKGIARKISNGEEDDAPTDEETTAMIDEILDEGSMEDAESELIRSAMEFDDKPVSHICVPRVDMVAVSKDADEETVKQLFISSEYTRIPVYEDTVDRIIGYITMKDFFLDANKDNGGSITKRLHPVRFFPESAGLDEVIRQMQKSHSQVGIVLDEYGGTSGMVTMEDLLEELVGEIYDESDEESHPIVAEDDGTFTVSGDANIFEVMENLGQEFECPEFGSVSVGGYVAYVLERIPHVGDEVRAGDAVITVNNIRTRRVRDVKIRIEPLEKPAEEQSENQD